jgi:hypothetical protein
LSQAIAAHVSAVQTKLGNEYGLHTVIEINQQGMSFSGESGQSSQRDQRSASGSSTIARAVGFSDADGSLSSTTLGSTGDGYRLDIRA